MLKLGVIGMSEGNGHPYSWSAIGVDTFICGETDNYGFRFAEEHAIAVIETSHEISEAVGLRIFADKLRSVIKTDVQYIDISCVWEMK